MPKPYVRLFMLAKDLGAAMKAVNKADSSFLSGMKIADNVKMPTVMKNPIVAKHPKSESIKVLSVELPRNKVKFDNYKTNLSTSFEDINAKKEVSLFANIGRRQLSAEGIMSSELFKDLAKQGKIKIHKEKPQYAKQPETEDSKFSETIQEVVGIPARIKSNKSQLTPAGFRELTIQNLTDADVLKASKRVLSTLSPNDSPMLVEYNKKLFGTPSERDVVVKAWEPHGPFKDYLKNVLNVGYDEFGDRPHETEALIAQSIRETAEQMLPISEPRKKGINRNLIYRRMFSKPKDE